MKHVTIVVPPPCEPDNALEKLYRKLETERADLLQKRSEATSVHATLAARHARLREQARVGYFGPNAQSAQAAAEALSAEVAMHTLEAEHLEHEVALLEKITDAYLGRVVRSRLKAVAVAHEMVGRARQKVVDAFRHQYDPWPYEPTTLERIVNEHPIVVAARNRIAEIENGNEAEYQSQLNETLRQARARLETLHNAIADAEAQSAGAADHAERIAAQIAADAAEAKANEDKRLAAQREAEAEASRRIAALSGN